VPSVICGFNFGSRDKTSSLRLGSGGAYPTGLAPWDKTSSLRLGSGGAYPTGLAPWDKTSSIRLGFGDSYPTGPDTPSAQRQQTKPDTSDPFMLNAPGKAARQGTIPFAEVRPGGWNREFSIASDSDET